MTDLTRTRTAITSRVSLVLAERQVLLSGTGVKNASRTIGTAAHPPTRTVPMMLPRMLVLATRPTLRRLRSVATQAQSTVLLAYQWKICQAACSMRRIFLKATTSPASHSNLHSKAYQISSKALCRQSMPPLHLSPSTSVLSLVRWNALRLVSMIRVCLTASQGIRIAQQDRTRTTGHSSTYHGEGFRKI